MPQRGDGECPAWGHRQGLPSCCAVTCRRRFSGLESHRSFRGGASIGRRQRSAPPSARRPIDSCRGRHGKDAGTGCKQGDAAGYAPVGVPQRTPLTLDASSGAPHFPPSVADIAVGFIRFRIPDAAATERPRSASLRSPRHSAAVCAEQASRSIPSIRYFQARAHAARFIRA